MVAGPPLWPARTTILESRGKADQQTNAAADDTALVSRAQFGTRARVRVAQ